MKIRWIGLGVSALLAVVAVAVGFGVGMPVRGGAYSSLGALLALGSVTMIGHVLFYVAFVLNLFVIPITGGYVKRADWSTGAKMLVGIFMTLVLAPLCLFRNAVIVLFRYLRVLFGR